MFHKTFVKVHPAAIIRTNYSTQSVTDHLVGKTYLSVASSILSRPLSGNKRAHFFQPN